MATDYLNNYGKQETGSSSLANKSKTGGPNIHGLSTQENKQECDFTGKSNFPGEIIVDRESDQSSSRIDINQIWRRENVQVQRTRQKHGSVYGPPAKHLECMMVSGRKRRNVQGGEGGARMSRAGR